MSDIQQVASRSRRVSAVSLGNSGSVQAISAGGRVGVAAEPGGHVAAGGEQRVLRRGLASGMRRMNQPSRRPEALNTTRRAPVARSTRRSTMAA